MMATPTSKSPTYMDLVTLGMLGVIRLLTYVICLPFALIGIFCYLAKAGVTEGAVKKDNHNPRPPDAKPPSTPPTPPPVDSAWSERVRARQL